ncbi:MAG TPA: transcription termination/antitermination NusG family protein [Bryobacteraceae bacterium]|nr:transcription termination/antitermination NusG family protein [Bryobacteraceae bacterium]
MQLAPQEPHFHVPLPVPLPWFAVKVRVRGEPQVAQTLRSREYECVLPTYPERRRYSDRLKRIEKALFPGYVFCRFDPLRRLPILTAPGVEHVVSVARVPEPVPDAEINAIRQIMQSGALAKPWPYLRVGQQVRIDEGSLLGIEGLLVQERGKDRLVVSIHLLQRSVAVQVDRESIRPV